MKQKRLFLVLLVSLLTALVLLSGCGKGKEKVKNDNVATPGRDKELYEQASEKLRKGRFDESRLLFNVIVSTYPDSEYLSLSKLAIADSYYLEGGSSNLEQAVAQYRDFVQYFPTHPRICDCYLKMAESYMRQMGAYNRDMSKANQAYRQLKSAQQKCSGTELKAQVDSNLDQVIQVMALHEVDVAETYLRRAAWKSVELRATEVIEKYRSSTFLDYALWLKGTALIEQEQPEEAASLFTELVRDNPNSEWAPEAKKYLEALGKPIPAPANNNPAPPRPGRIDRIRLIFGQNNLVIRKSGVMIDRKGRIDRKEEEKTVAPQSDAPNDFSSVRSGPRRVTEPQQTPEATATQAPTATNSAQPAAKSEDAKAKEPKKKKGLFGIFK